MMPFRPFFGIVKPLSRIHQLCRISSRNGDFAKRDRYIRQEDTISDWNSCCSESIGAPHKALDPFGIEIPAHSLADSRFERSRLSLGDQLAVADATLNEDMTGTFCDAFKIIWIARISELDEGDDRGQAKCQPFEHEIRVDKAGRAGIDFLVPLLHVLLSEATVAVSIRLRTVAALRPILPRKVYTSDRF
jgi:hypothetical protein